MLFILIILFYFSCKLAVDEAVGTVLKEDFIPVTGLRNDTEELVTMCLADDCG